MTDAEIAAARALVEAATPGPWEVGHDERECAATLRAQPCYASERYDVWLSQNPHADHVGTVTVQPVVDEKEIAR